MSERDQAWQRFFDRSSTLQQVMEQGYCPVTADALKQFGEREPRLMAKIDTLAERPRIFQQHHLSIFPTKNGEYVLFRDPADRTYYRFSRELHSLPVQTHISNVDLYAYDSFPGPQGLNESQAIYLGLVKREDRRFCLTALGEQYLQLRSHVQRSELVVCQ